MKVHSYGVDKIKGTIKVVGEDVYAEIRNLLDIEPYITESPNIFWYHYDERIIKALDRTYMLLAKCEHCGEMDILSLCNTPEGKAMLCDSCMFENSDVMRVYLTNILPSTPKGEEYSVEKKLGLQYPGKKRGRR